MRVLMRVSTQKLMMLPVHYDSNAHYKATHSYIDIILSLFTKSSLNTLSIGTLSDGMRKNGTEASSPKKIGYL